MLLVVAEGREEMRTYARFSQPDEGRQQCWGNNNSVRHPIKVFCWLALAVVHRTLWWTPGQASGKHLPPDKNTRHRSQAPIFVTLRKQQNRRLYPRIQGLVGHLGSGQLQGTILATGEGGLWGWGICTYMSTYREPELEIAARIGITPEAYKVLRKLKAERKQSMVRIVSNLILNEEVPKLW